MNTFFTQAVALGLAAVLPEPALAQETIAPVVGEAEEVAPLSGPELWEADRTRVFDASEIDLDDFVWIARPVVVFADSPVDPNFRRQMDLLLAEPEELAERDVIIVTDTDPDARTDIRIQLRPRGFMMALVAKDGRVSLRKPLPWDVRELTRSIDKMPLRQQEIEDRRAGSI